MAPMAAKKADDMQNLFVPKLFAPVFFEFFHKRIPSYVLLNCFSSCFLLRLTQMGRPWGQCFRS